MTIKGLKESTPHDAGQASHRISLYFAFMPDIVHYTHCPVCSSSNIHSFMTVKDHSVTGETFEVWECKECTLRFTQDVPAEQQIGKYYASENYISHTNTSKGLVNATYQRVRKFTLAAKASLVISRTKAKGSLLDVGCGIGAFLSVMKEKGWEVTGIEPSAEARAVAESEFGIKPLEAENFQHLPSSHFDAITLWHVLEHVHALHPYMRKLKAMLKNRGKIFIAVPNYTSDDAAAYAAYWAAYDVPRHLYHFSPASIQKLASIHGLKIREKKPMWFDSFYISLLSSKYKAGKTQYIGSVINGLRSNLKAIADNDRCSSITYILENVSEKN